MIKLLYEWFGFKLLLPESDESSDTPTLLFTFSSFEPTNVDLVSLIEELDDVDFVDECALSWFFILKLLLLLLIDGFRLKNFEAKSNLLLALFGAIVGDVALDLSDSTPFNSTDLSPTAIVAEINSFCCFLLPPNKLFEKKNEVILEPVVDDF